MKAAPQGMRTSGDGRAWGRGALSTALVALALCAAAIGVGPTDLLSRAEAKGAAKADETKGDATSPGDSGAKPAAEGVPPDAATDSAAQQQAQLQAEIDKFELPPDGMLAWARKKAGSKAFVPPPRPLQPFANAAVGDRLAYTIVQDRTIVEAPAAKALAEQVMAKLLDAWGGPKPDFDIEIEAKPDFSAESMRWGVMLVPLGAFDMDDRKGAASTNELALLLGHELSHYLLHHVEHQAFRAAIVDKLRIAASGWVTYGAIKNTSVDDNGHVTVTADPATMRRAMLAGMATNMLIGDLVGPSFNRQSEVQADLLGIDLAIAAGYQINQSQIENFITRHTADAIEKTQRMEVLEAVVQDASGSLGASIGKQVSSGGLFDISSMVSTVASKMASSAFEELAKATVVHPDPALRLGVMKRYYLKFHATGDADQLVKVDRQSLMAVKSSPQVRPVLEMVKRASAEYQAMALADAKAGATADGAAKDSSDSPPSASLVTAVSQIGRVGHGSGKHHASPATAAVSTAAPGITGTGAESFTPLVEGNLAALRYNNHTRAREAWVRSALSTYPSIPGAQAASGELMAGAERVRDQAIVDHFGKVLGTTDPVMFLSVGADVARGDIAGAEVLAARCVGYNGGTLYAFCAQQLGYDPLQKGVSAKTPEGQKAFAGKSIEKSIGGWFSTLKDIF